MPAGSTIVPSESDRVMDLQPSSFSFSTVYWATFPEPETRAVLPRTLSPRVRQHFLSEIDAAVTGRFRPQQGTAVFQPFAGQHAAEPVDDSLVLPEQEADLPPADADVPGGNVGVGADVAIEFGHEGLAEAHHFVVALALRIKIRSTFATAHRQRRQAVLEHLLEGQELQHAQRDGRVEPQAPFVRADGTAHLNPKAAIDLDFAPVIDPGNSEQDHALRLDHPFQDLGLAISRPVLDDRHDRLDHLAHGLMEFDFARVLGHDLGHELFDGGVGSVACLVHKRDSFGGIMT